jgi:citrate lyase beta subunit
MSQGKNYRVCPTGSGSAVAGLPPLVRETGDSPPSGTAWLAFLPHADATIDALAGALRAGATGILAGGISGAAEIERLDARLQVAEGICGLPDGSARLAGTVATAAGVAALPAFARTSERLVALGLDGPALAADLGLPADAASAPALVVARGLVVIAARAADVPAFEILPRGAPAQLRTAEAAAEGFACVLVPDDGLAV